MSSEQRDELDVRYEDRVQKIREAAIDAIRQLDQLRSTGSMPREALAAKVAQIAQEKLHLYGCDLVVHRTDGGLTRFLSRSRTQGEDTI